MEWVQGFDSFIGAITTRKEKMKPYSVTIYYSGSMTYCVDSSDDSEAEETASEMFYNDAGDLEDIEITDIETTEEDPNE